MLLALLISLLVPYQSGFCLNLMHIDVTSEKRLTRPPVLYGNGKFGFWMGTLIGLVGVFGLGQLYLGRKRRGLTFLAATAALAVYVAIGFFLLPQVWGTAWSPTTVFGLLWIVQTYDLYNLAKVPKLGC